MTPERRKTRLRCAIYTRVSSDAGLEQDFNSLDNQREAAEAYVKSQAHEGWILIRDRFDDGGFSGGSMDRPALQKLLEEVREGRIDVVVVYKVDRLTRSLTDFAKLVDVLDARSVSFVSVTQAFNTTTSMGAIDPKRAALIRAIRPRGHGREDSRQDRRLEEKGTLDGRRSAPRLSGRKSRASCGRGSRRLR
jgi:DNA invertase Pin-like site-specific DNA recombinase